MVLGLIRVAAELATIVSAAWIHSLLPDLPQNSNP
jgi:hypothetical protein